MPSKVLRIDVGDIVRLRKPHPCGSREWEVLRTGADIRARCRGCGRLIMMARSEFERRIAAFIHRSNLAPEAGSPGGPSGAVPDA